MQIPEEHVQAAVEAFGYSPREARFLWLVTAFSGHLLRSQWCRFASIPLGRGAQQLLDRLLDNGHANAYDHNGHHRYHVFGKPLYRVFGRENSNHRRRPSATLLSQRLGSLDFALANLDVPFLLTEAERRSFCEETLGIADPAVLPRRTYYMHGKRGPATDVLFPDRFPMAGDSREVVFTYADSPLDSLVSFRSHLRLYGPLLSALRTPWRFVFISGRDYKIKAAERVFHDTLAGTSPSLHGTSDPDLLRYFELELRVEKKEWATLLQTELVDRANLKARYSAPKYAQLYDEWRAGKLQPAPEPLSSPLAHLREFSTFLAPTLAV
jgi:hypothetical protein